MSIFGKIKEAIFGKQAKPAPTPPPAVDTTQAPGSPAPDPSRTAAIDLVNVENNLDNMPGADRLNWRTSIVDLMKLIGVPSDYESRRALAQELGRTEYAGSAQDNVWLHRKTMQELSRSGGRVPAEFLD